MNKRIVMFFVFIFVLPIFLLPSSTLAAANNHLLISHLEIQVMPEYDRPEGWTENKPNLLTGFYGVMINKSTEPFEGKIQWRVSSLPTTKVHLVAELDTGKDLEIPVPYYYDPAKNVIEWTPSSPLQSDVPYYFAVEYYNSPFQSTHQERKLVFDFSSDYNIEDAQLYFYEPFNAIGFTLSQPYQGRFQNKTGQWIYHMSKGFLPKNDRFGVTAAYFKEGYETFSEKPQVSMENSNKDVPQKNNLDPIQMILVSSAVLLTVLLVLAWWKKGRKSKCNGKGREAIDEEIKKLRRKLVNEECTVEQYMYERKKLG